MAKLSYMISIDEWVFRYEGAMWKAPQQAVQLANSAPYKIEVPVAWLLIHGDRLKIYEKNDGSPLNI